MIVFLRLPIKENIRLSHPMKLIHTKKNSTREKLKQKLNLPGYGRLMANWHYWGPGGGATFTKFVNMRVRKYSDLSDPPPGLGINGDLFHAINLSWGLMAFMGN